jgi:hypothetical protein
VDVRDQEDPLNSKKLFGLFVTIVLAGAVSASVPTIVQAQTPPPKKQRVYVVATSDYVCTPSGFGQRARCYLKDN